MIITKGYLLKREDYDLFDEIVTFINQYGLVFKCFSSGSRKINSKNGRHLNYGNWLEFEFFYSQNKLSRLKKVSTISYIDEKYKNKWSLEFINEIYCQIKIDNKKFFDFYQDVINMIINNFNDYYIIVLICIKIIKLLNLPIKIKDVNEVNFILYGDNKKIVFSKLMCDNIYEIFTTEKINMLDQFNLNEIKLLILQFTKFINNNTNIFVTCLKWLI